MRLIFYFGIFILIFGCVSSKKYKSLIRQNQKLQHDKLMLAREVYSFRIKSDTLKLNETIRLNKLLAEKEKEMLQFNTRNLLKVITTNKGKSKKEIEQEIEAIRKVMESEKIEIMDVEINDILSNKNSHFDLGNYLNDIYIFNMNNQQICYSIKCNICYKTKYSFCVEAMSGQKISLEKILSKTKTEDPNLEILFEVYTMTDGKKIPQNSLLPVTSSKKQSEISVFKLSKGKIYNIEYENNKWGVQELVKRGKN